MAIALHVRIYTLPSTIRSTPASFPHGPRATGAKTKVLPCSSLDAETASHPPSILVSNYKQSVGREQKSGNRRVLRRGQLTPGQSTEVDEINYGPKPWGHGLMNSLS